MLFALLQLGGTVQVSHEHPIQSISMIAAIITFFYGVLILPVLGLAGGLPLLSKNVRRSKLLIALCVITLCIPAMLTLNLFGWLLYLPMMGPLDALQRSHEIKVLTVREGVPIPPGSKIEDAQVGSRSYTVQLSVPTTANGLRWTGELEVDAKELDATEGLLSGTLAEPAVIQGVPCAAGKATVAKHSLDCTLSRDTLARGYLLAGGHQVRLSFDDGGGIASIERATTAKPFRFQGTVWPAGLRVSPNKAVGENPDDPRLAWDELFGSICVEKGADVLFHGSTLHGPVEVRFNAAETELGNSCDSLDEGLTYYGSIRTADGAVHRQGHMDHDAKSWTWTDENVSAKYVDGAFGPED